MANLLNPPAVIFINSGLHPKVIQTIERQLYITETMSGEEFNARVDGYSSGYIDGYSDGYGFNDGYVDGYYRAYDQRILVLCNLYTQRNREKADLVLVYRYGLVYVESKKRGPPAKGISIQNVYLLDLLKS